MGEGRTVFISSTSEDLRSHREAAIEALYDWTCVNVMEARGAAPGTPLENCLRWVRESDVYLGILGMRYGSREPTTNLSFTELEYDEAVKLGLPRLVYVLDEKRHPLVAAGVDRGRDADDLARFKSKVSDLKGFFRSPENLQFLVHRDVRRLFDARGWSPPGDTPDSLSRGMEWRIRLCAWELPGASLVATVPSAESEVFEADVAASVLVSRFARGDYSDLNGVVSLRPGIRNALRLLLKYRDIDEVALEKAIREADIASSQGILYLRLLIDVAGIAESAPCAEPVCQIVLYAMRDLDDEIAASLGQARSLRPLASVCTEALARMPLSATDVIAQYLERARAGKRWQAKRVLERALRIVREAGRPARHQV